MRDTKQYQTLVQCLEQGKKFPGPRTKDYQQVFSWIREQTKHLSGPYWKMSQRVWYLENQRTPRCPVCESPSKLTTTIPVQERCCSAACAAQNPKRQEKIHKTLEEKYGIGITNISQVPEVAAKISETNSGVSKPWAEGPYHGLTKHQSNCLYDPEWLYDQHITQNKTPKTIADELGLSYKTVCIHIDRNDIPRKKFRRSSLEDQVLKFIREDCGYTQDIWCNKHFGDLGEIDLYLPDLNLAIEIDGMFWHSYHQKESRDQRLKHQNKQLEARKQGINLLQIWESEWSDDLRQERVWKNLIGAKIGTLQAIRASKCQIRHNIPVEQQRTFLNYSHLQGWCQSSFSVGLYYDDVLVYLMTFGKPRFSDKFEWELIRLCCHPQYRVHGGASRCFKKFLDVCRPRNLVSFHDCRLGQARVYSALGGTLIETTQPSYCYWKQHKPLISRYQAQKKRLPKILGSGFNSDESESQNMFNNKYRRMWDAGNDKYVWNF